MKTTKITFISILTGILSLSAVNALEFAEVGHKAAGMGGVGVAVKNSPYGLFFNPALLAAKPGVKVGYSFQLAINEKNTFSLVNTKNMFSVNPIPSTPDSLNSKFANNYLNVSAHGALVGQLPTLPIGQIAIGMLWSEYMSSGFIGRVKNGFDASGGAMPDGQISVHVTDIKILEVPIGYAYAFDLGALGKLSLGLSAKFMNGAYGKQSRDQLGASNSDFDENKLLSMVNKSRTNDTSTTFGIDAGVTYQPLSPLTLGVVVKNLNAPAFKFRDTKLIVKPQARAGIGFSATDRITVGADIDLTSNDVFTANGQKLKSQKIGLGADLDLIFLSVRGGIAKDLQQDNGVILSAGVGIGFIDASLSFGTATTESQFGTHPRYIALSIGGGFTF